MNHRLFEYQLGKIIRARRKEMKISMIQLADKSKICRSTMQRIETGNVCTSMFHLIAICIVLDIDLNQLIKDLSKYLDKSLYR